VFICVMSFCSGALDPFFLYNITIHSSSTCSKKRKKLIDPINMFQTLAHDGHSYSRGINMKVQ
jgi:hypothetical protein